MHRLLPLAVCAAAAICAPLALGAAARTVTIELVLQPRGEGSTSSFTLSGALSDAGAVLAQQPVLGIKRGLGGGNAPRLTLKGRHGTLTIAFLRADAPADADWAISSASGAYRGLRGGGEIASRRVVAGASRLLLRGTVASR